MGRARRQTCVTPRRKWRTRSVLCAWPSVPWPLSLASPFHLRVHVRQWFCSVPLGAPDICPLEVQICSFHAAKWLSHLAACRSHCLVKTREHVAARNCPFATFAAARRGWQPVDCARIVAAGHGKAWPALQAANAKPSPDWLPRIATAGAVHDVSTNRQLHPTTAKVTSVDLFQASNRTSMHTGDPPHSVSQGVVVQAAKP